MLTTISPPKQREFPTLDAARRCWRYEHDPTFRSIVGYLLDRNRGGSLSAQLDSLRGDQISRDDLNLYLLLMLDIYIGDMGSTKPRRRGRD
jgi:hypothetical protein